VTLGLGETVVEL